MSQTGMDPNAPVSEQPKPGAAGATTQQAGASSSRRRHHRAESKHPSGRGDTATSTTPAAATHVEAAQAPTPRTSTRAAPRSRSAAPAAPVAPAAEAAPTQPERATASSQERTGTRRANTRRPSRARTPKLVPQPRPEAETAALLESTAPGAEPASPVIEAIPDIPLPEPVASAPAPDESSPAESFEAHIATLSPSQANQVVEQVAEAATGDPHGTPPAPPARRYRFDRPARPAPERHVRPERLSSISAAPEAAPSPAPVSMPTAPSIPATAAQAIPADVPRRVPVTAAEAMASPPSTLADELALTLSADHPDDHQSAPAELSPTAPASAPSGAELDATTASGHAGTDQSESPAQEAEEGAATHKRRRRRRGNGTGSAVRHLEAIVPAEQMEVEPPTPLVSRAGSRTGHTGSGGAPPSAGERADEYGEQPIGGTYSGYGVTRQPYDLYAPQQPEPWDITNAYQQIGQTQSPFASPEPNIPRGFGPQPQGVAGPAHERPTRPARTERGTDTPPMSANQLGAVLTQAIQQQTDRLLTELRHTQAPPSMTVQFPPLPSTERIGVFVDVANLLYAARNLRLSIDFGHLLEFLRGNRRLIRAHAYAPTSPEPNAEQQFLSVVKGVGYRITTKHYKTFSSGAKKADLDLDMCMDIVRLVDAKAVDTIALVSGDSDFLPLLEYCSDHGVRVEVAAFDDSAAMILRQSCDLFINLSLVPDIRA